MGECQVPGSVEPRHCGTKKDPSNKDGPSGQHDRDHQPQRRPASYPSTFQTKGDAEGWLAAERRLIQDDRWSPARSRRAKVRRATEAFGPYAEAWLEHREVKPRTRSHYRRLLDRFILPSLGDMALRDITPSIVRVWHSELDPSHPTQRAHAYALLRTVLTTAVTDEILDAHPCRIRGAGVTHRARRIEPASLEELDLLVAEMPDRYRTLVLLAAWCGLRIGELAELRRQDLDLTRGVIRVTRGVTRYDGHVSVGTPKSEAGIRDVTIPPHLRAVVEGHLARHVLPAREALVFASVKDPAIQVHPNTIYRSWHPARERVGRPDLRIHDLRHTGAVLAAQTGATLAELMARIGHSTPQAALRYQHAARGRDAQIAEGLSELAAAHERAKAERARLTTAAGQDETPAMWLSPGIVPGPS